MNDNRVVLDSSKSLKTMDELKDKLKELIKYHEELVSAFDTAYKNDNLFFYSKMGKLAGHLKELLMEACKKFEDLSEQLVEHSNRMAKLSEEY